MVLHAVSDGRDVVFGDAVTVADKIICIAFLIAFFVCLFGLLMNL